MAGGGKRGRPRSKPSQVPLKSHTPASASSPATRARQQQPRRDDSIAEPDNTSSKPQNQTPLSLEQIHSPARNLEAGSDTITDPTTPADLSDEQQQHPLPRMTKQLSRFDDFLPEVYIDTPIVSALLHEPVEAMFPP